MDLRNMDLVFSDIHADINSLNSILEIAESKDFKNHYGEFSRILNLGDVLERGTHPKEVLEKLDSMKKTHSVVSVIGNHDEAFLYGRKVSGSSFESIDAHSRLIPSDLESFPQNRDKSFGQQEFLDKKNGLLMVHGGPLDPEKIIPKNAGPESWLYQKTWQRLTQEKSEFFSYYGYHYLASSAFKESKLKMKNFVILCGHQHEEAALEENQQGIKEILSETKPKKEKILNFSLEKKEFEINPSHNYLIRLGLAGPEGYYGIGTGNIHFGIVQYNPKKVILFGIL